MLATAAATRRRLAARAHGVDATVTPLGGSAVVTIVIPDEGGPLAIEADTEVTRPAPTFAVPRADVPTLRVASTILAPRLVGQAPTLWRVIRVDDLHPEYLTAVVEPA